MPGSALVLMPLMPGRNSGLIVLANCSAGRISSLWRQINGGQDLFAGFQSGLMRYITTQILLPLVSLRAGGTRRLNRRAP